MAELHPENRPQYLSQHQELLPPPRIVVVLTVGGFIALITGILISIFIFRNVLRPGQQQRVIDLLPGMTAFLPQNSGSGVALPTPLPTYATAISNIGLLYSDLTPLATTATQIVITPITELTTTPIPSLTTVAIADTPISMTIVASVIETPISLTPTATQIPPSAHLYGFDYVQQTWNNCGPATITMGLSYFGWEESQEFAASFLKPDDEDKNVTPREMVAFVNEQSGIRAITRMGGNLELLKLLINNGFPVIISIGFMPEGYDWLGHYRAIVGYDDYRQVLYAYDSFLGMGENGAGIAVSYSEIDRDWQQFNRNFIVLFQERDEDRLNALLGERADPMLAAEIALQIAQNESRSDPQNGFLWFNMGTALTSLERYEEAALAFDQSRRFTLPWRMMWYQFAPYEAYFNVGRYDDVSSLVSANLNNGGRYIEETYYWQGRVYAAQDKVEDARRSFNQALQINPLYTLAKEALDELGSES